MRASVFLIAVILAAPVRGEEVVLFPRDLAHFPRLVNTDALHAEALPEPPEGATAPERAASWGRIHLGDQAHLFCFSGLDGTEPRLRVDRDGDGDLVDEEPVPGRHVAGHMPGMGHLGFELKGLPGRFSFGKNSVAVTCRLRLTPPDVLRCYTVFAPRAAPFDLAYGPCWLPGTEPALYNFDAGIVLDDLILGAGRVKIDGPPRFENGRPVMAYRMQEGGLTAVRAPGDLMLVSAVKAGYARGPFVPRTVSVAEGGRVRLPEGRWRMTLDVRRREGGLRHRCVVLGREVAVKAEATIGPVEPLSLEIRLKETGEGPEAWVLLKDAAGNYDVRLFSGAERTGLPTLVVKDGTGNVVERRALRWAGPHPRRERFALPPDPAGGSYVFEAVPGKTAFRTEPASKAWTPGAEEEGR